MNSQQKNDPSVDIVDDEVDDVQETLPAEIQSIVRRGKTFDAEAALAEFQYRAEILRKVRPLALSELRPTDFVKMGDTCYLQGSGSERAEMILGIVYPEHNPPKRTRIDLGGGEFAYMLEGYVGSKTLGQVVYVVGGRASNEKFFDKFEDPEEEGGEPRRLPVPELDVIKAASTNFKNRAIAGLLGLRGLTQDDLKEMGFKHADKIRGFSYQKGGKGSVGGSNTIPNFGPEHCRGKEWSDPAVTKDDLRFYHGALKQSIGDPKKAKWKKRNEDQLAALMAEVNRRRGSVEGEGEGS